MKLIHTKVDELTRNLTGGELIDATLHYKVDKAWGELAYKGPKIPRELWCQVVSFLKWANDTAKSEAQVRLFVSLKHNTWKAWAFPQEGFTGLSSKEIQDDSFQQQRAALFKDDSEWSAWGTVHSHASAPAFQSGTDEDDEVKQGGLHITVGSMDASHYSLHARLYHREDKYEPDMSAFWDTGDPLKDLPPEILIMLPETPHDKLARIQMCVPVMVEFPEQWKQNYRKPVPREWPMTNGKSIPSNGLKTQKECDKWLARHPEHQLPGPGKTYDMEFVGINSPFYVRLQAAIKEVTELELMYSMEEGGIMSVLNYMSEQVPEEIVAICKQYGLLPSDIISGIRKLEVEMAEQEKNLTGQPGID